MVHKKKHDMVLNLGLGARGNTFSDQTPTPTRFIRNCEEVGLFQDLQNVNPFEETFKRAVEAVKAGQTPILEKSFQSNPCDDTLHTPNIFPHITDLPGRNHNADLGRQDNKRLDDNLPKKDNVKNFVDKELFSKNVLESNKLFLGNTIHERRKLSLGNESVVKEVQNNQILLVNEEKDKTGLKNLQSHDSANGFNGMQTAVKEKIKKNINNKQVPMLIELKVPNPKARAAAVNQRLEKDKFSTFAKNSLKYECNTQKPESGIFDINKKKNNKKNYNGLTKEKLEILERNRAAATRCRQKKKIYISHLEKLNRELTDTNKKLLSHNSYLKKQVFDLQAELSKHHNCNVSNSKEETETVIASIGNTIISCKKTDQSDVDGKISNNIPNELASRVNYKTNNKIQAAGGVSNNAGVSLTDKLSSDSQNLSGRTSNESFTSFYTKPCLLNSIYDVDRLRKIYIDHSYFNYPYLSKIRKKYQNSRAAKSKLTPGFLTMNVTNQNFMKENDKAVDVLLSQTESVIEVQTEEVVTL